MTCGPGIVNTGMRCEPLTLNKGLSCCVAICQHRCVTEHKFRLIGCIIVSMGVVTDILQHRFRLVCCSIVNTGINCRAWLATQVEVEHSCDEQTLACNTGLSWRVVLLSTQV